MHAQDYYKQRSCSPHENKKAKDELTWVATVGCPVLFISLMIEGLQVRVFWVDFSHPLHPVLKSRNTECLLCARQFSATAVSRTDMTLKELIFKHVTK